MNETLNLPGLISELASRAQCSPAYARRFIRDVFSLIESELADDKSVEVKDLGDFTLSGDIEKPVLFRPDSGLAKLLNEPFEAFDPVELPDEVSLDEINETPAQPAPAEEIVAPAAPIVETVETPLPEPEPEESKNEEPEIEQPKTEEPQPAEPKKFTWPEEESDENESETDPEDTEVNNDTDQPETPQVHHHSSTSPALWLILGLLMGLLIGLFAGFFAGRTMGQYSLPDDEISFIDSVAIDTPDEPADDLETANPQDGTITPEPEPAQTPEIETSVPAPPPVAPAPVYDTITKNRFLTTMAGEHYGVKNWWIFIYEANPGLGDPGKVRPGTRILIPSRESFEEPTRTQTDAKAQRLLNALSKKYKL